MSNSTNPTPFTQLATQHNQFTPEHRDLQESGVQPVAVAAASVSQTVEEDEDSWENMADSDDEESSSGSGQQAAAAARRITPVIAVAVRTTTFPPSWDDDDPWGDTRSSSRRAESHDSEETEEDIIRAARSSTALFSTARSSTASPQTIEAVAKKAAWERLRPELEQRARSRAEESGAAAGTSRITATVDAFRSLIADPEHQELTVSVWLKNGTYAAGSTITSPAQRLRAINLYQTSSESTKRKIMGKIQKFEDAHPHVPKFVEGTFELNSAVIRQLATEFREKLEAEVRAEEEAERARALEEELSSLRPKLAREAEDVQQGRAEKKAGYRSELRRQSQVEKANRAFESGAVEHKPRGGVRGGDKRGGDKRGGGRRNDQDGW